LGGENGDLPLAEEAVQVYTQAYRGGNSLVFNLKDFFIDEEAYGRMVEKVLRSLWKAQVEEARAKILEAVKSLEAEGKINFRSQDTQEVYIIDGGDLSSGDQRRKKFESMGGQKPQEAPAAAPAADPARAAEAAQYATAGADLYNQGRLEESLQYLEYATAANPADPSGWQYLGAAYYGLGRIDDAVAAYEKYAAAAGDPASREWVNGFRQQVGK